MWRCVGASASTPPSRVAAPAPLIIPVQWAAVSEVYRSPTSPTGTPIIFPPSTAPRTTLAGLGCGGHAAAMATSRSLRELLALAMPVTCAGCGAEGEPVCRACRLGVGLAAWPGGPRAVSPDPRPEGLPETVSTARFAPPLSRIVAAYKDDGRRDCLP